jgi:hypothetical protein
VHYCLQVWIALHVCIAIENILHLGVGRKFSCERMPAIVDRL